MTEWTDYIDAVCLKDDKGIVPPLEQPEYDPDAETWDLYFEYDSLNQFTGRRENDLVCLPFESKEEAHKAIQEIQEEREKIA
jgi:hypothetical protein